MVVQIEPGRHDQEVPQGDLPRARVPGEGRRRQDVDEPLVKLREDAVLAQDSEHEGGDGLGGGLHVPDPEPVCRVAGVALGNEEAVPHDQKGDGVETSRSE